MKVTLCTEELRQACYEYLQKRIGGEPKTAPGFISGGKYIDALMAEISWETEKEEE